MAGIFYPADPAALREQLEACLRSTAEDTGERDEGSPAIGAMAPHAGYAFSGRIAGAVFRAIPGPTRVVLLAPNHTGLGWGVAALWPGPAFETPLGKIPVDGELAEALQSACGFVRPELAAHLHEHAVEVLLPFLQVSGRDVRVLPVILGFDEIERVEPLGRAIADVAKRLDPGLLILASSDMNHYEPADVGRRKDRRALETVERLEPLELLEVTAREGITMCGRIPAATMLVAAKALGARSATVVAYGHSGEVTGDDRSVVGYAGVVVR